MMRVLPLLFFLAAAGIIFPLTAAEPDRAVQGIIDLSRYKGEKNWEATLDGQWEFYWETWLESEDFDDSPNQPEPEFLSVPGNWNSVGDYPSHGYTTIRLRITGLERGRNYSLYIPEMLTAFRFFLDGKEVYSNGRTGANREESTPQFHPGLVTFKSESSRTEIIIQISNYDHRNSGIWRSLSIGTQQTLMNKRKGKLLLEMFIAAVLLTISLFHIAIYFFRREALAELLFGLCCLLLFFRTMTTGEQLINQIFPAFHWGLARRLEYSPFFAVAPLFMLFLSELFPRESVKKLNTIFLSLFIVLGVFFLVFPVRISNHAILIAELMLVIAMLYAISILSRALKNRRDHAIPILIAFLLLTTAVVNDILFSRQIINTRYLAPQGFILFIFIQSQMLSKRYAKSFREVENLTHQLRDLNESLSRFVPFQFLEYLKKNSILDVQLGDQVLENMTILFADIRSFTSLSEVMTPEENFKFLNSFLSQVVPVIRQQGGFVDKFIGDAIMALFPYPPDKAVRAAIELQNAVKRYNRARNRAGYREISLGIGIHTGQLMLGTIGETNRMETTVIADTVNIASRLEDLTKTYGARIIISKELFEKMDDKSGITSRSLGLSPVKGKAEPLEIIEILDQSRNSSDEAKIDSLNDFEEAVNLIQEGQYDKAATLLKAIMTRNPDDAAAAYFLKHCSQIDMD